MCLGCYFANIVEAIAAAVRGTPRSRRRLSSYVYMDAILYYFNEQNVLPKGITTASQAVRDYACRAGLALRKLVSLSNNQHDGDSVAVLTMTVQFRLPSSSHSFDGHALPGILHLWS